MKRNYVGFSTTFHDSSIAIVNSRGEIVFAEAIERYMQSKRALNIAPDQLFYIPKLLKRYIEPGAEIIISNSWSENLSRSLPEIASKVTALEDVVKSNGIDLPASMLKYLNKLKYYYNSQRHMEEQSNKTIQYILSQMEDYGGPSVVSIKKYDHHLAHAATACYTSRFSEACCAIFDGFGENKAYGCFHYHDQNISLIPGIASSTTGSLGSYFSEVCNICGLDFFAGEEWKIMGLAAYGNYDESVYDVLRSFIRVDGLNLHQCVGINLVKYFSQVDKICRKNNAPLDSCADIAYTGQLLFNEMLVKYLNNLYELNLSDNLILGGGCALNSSANGLVVQKTGFKNLYIFSAPADDGNAIGAALLAYYDDHPFEKRSSLFQIPYLGSEISEFKVKQMEKYSGIKNMKTYADEVYVHTAKLIADGKIVGWVQGKAEFGPRALGNRSILADPRCPNIKEILNERVKYREEYRPLAPSILHEYGDEYFEHYQESPYMERALLFKLGKRELVPGVVHKDGTGRLQTVKKEWNERYYNLIHAFFLITGIPLVINTSFNVMGKPIIHSLEDALAVFFTSGLDALVINDIVIEK